jgi:hypothetical protein
MLPEAKEKLLGEMKAVFAARFEVNEEKRVAVKELLCVFESSRGEMTESERNLFNRHSKRLFLDLWPHSDWDANSEIPCYYHMSVKSASPEVVEVSTDDEPVMAKKRPYKMGVNRMPRAAGTMPHRADNHRKFKAEMEKVFSRKFKEVPGARVEKSDLKDVFATSRTAKGKTFSAKDENLLNRHGRKACEKQWPNAKYHVIRDVGGYDNIARKTTGTFFCFSGALILTPDASAEDGAAELFKPQGA